MEKSRIYCEEKIIKELFNYRPSDKNFDDPNSIAYWNNFLILLLNSELYLNLAPEEFLSKSISGNLDDEILRIIRRKSSSGSECVLNLCVDNFPNVSNIEKHVNEDSIFSQSLFLLDLPKEVCDNIESDFGLLVLNNDNIKERCNLMFKGFSQPIEKRSTEIIDWTFLNKYSFPCNSLVIFDSYINKNRSENLFEILSIMLPERLKIPFHITISTLKDTIDFDDLKESVESFLKQNKPNLEYRLCILSYPKDYIHDRNLLTNYLHINSGIGFDIFKRKMAQKDTIITGKVATSYNSDDIIARRSLFKIYSKIFIEAKQKPPLVAINYWGVKENRLLYLNI